VVAYAFPRWHRSICWLRATIGPGRELFRAIIDLGGRPEQSAAALSVISAEIAGLAGLVYATMAFSNQRQRGANIWTRRQSAKTGLILLVSGRWS
jgi:hypothetical protein